MGFEVSVRMLACVSRPPRLAGALTRRNSRAVDAVDAVVPGQAVVDEGEVGVEEVEDAAVLAQDGLEEQLGLASASRRAGRRRTAGRAWRRARRCGSLRSVSHWPAKFCDEGGRLRVLEHPPTCGRQVLRAARRCRARSNSSSSGIVLQRKYDRRLASSNSLIW